MMSTETINALAKFIAEKILKQPKDRKSVV